MIRASALDKIVTGGDVTIADDILFMEGRILESTGFIGAITSVEETYGVECIALTLGAAPGCCRRCDDWLSRLRRSPSGV